jgi:hypothetical protein
MLQVLDERPGVEIIHRSYAYLPGHESALYPASRLIRYKIRNYHYKNRKRRQKRNGLPGNNTNGLSTNQCGTKRKNNPTTRRKAYERNTRSNSGMGFSALNAQGWIAGGQGGQTGTHNGTHRWTHTVTV